MIGIVSSKSRKSQFSHRFIMGNSGRTLEIADSFGGNTVVDAVNGIVVRTGLLKKQLKRTDFKTPVTLPYPARYLFWILPHQINVPATIAFRSLLERVSLPNSGGEIDTASFLTDVTARQ